MSSRFYRPPDNDYTPSNTDILDDLAQRRAKEELIPIIAKKSRNALNVTPVYIEYFQRLKTGRRCSCWSVEDSPAGACYACHSVGVVGGYNKRGTKTEVFDVTYPDVISTNIKPNYDVASRPIYWTLVDTATKGTLEFNINITVNSGILDILDIKDFQPINSTSILYEIKAPSESSYVTLSENNLESRLSNSKLNCKITMERETPQSALPKLGVIRIAYKLIKITSLRADIPRVTESLTLEEFGVYESWTNQNFFLDNTLQNATTEDFLINLLDGTRWKVVEVRDNKPLGILTSWDLTCRKVQSYDTHIKVPQGTVDDSLLPPNYVRSIQTDAELIEQYNETTTRGDRKPGHRVDNTQVKESVTEPGITTPKDPLREV